jgi:hypothetical protein
MQQIVQPLVRGFDTMRGHLRTIVQSIFSMLSRPRVDSGMVGLRGAAGSQPDPAEVGPSARPATMPDGRLELWDLVLKSQSEDWLPVPEPDRDGMTRDGTAGQDSFMVALLSLALREVRRSPLGPLRRQGSASPNLPRRERPHRGQAGQPDLRSCRRNQGVRRTVVTDSAIDPLRGSPGFARLETDFGGRRP